MAIADVIMTDFGAQPAAPWPQMVYRNKTASHSVAYDMLLKFLVVYSVTVRMNAGNPGGGASLPRI
jgi:hypothetical protein